MTTSDVGVFRLEAKPALKLYYFDIPGKGEAIRLACTYGGIPFDDVRLGRDKFLEMKQDGRLPFGQLPALQVDDQLLVQSAAILRFVGKLANLYPTGSGSDDIYAAKIDAAMDEEADMFVGLSVSRYKERFGFGYMSPDDVKVVRQSLNDEVLPRHLTFLENLMRLSSTGWIAGGPDPSIADFALVPRLQWLCEPGVHDGIDCGILDSYPLLGGLIQRFMALPSVDAYYKSRTQLVK